MISVPAPTKAERYLAYHTPRGPVGPFQIDRERVLAFLLQVDKLGFQEQEKADLFAAPFSGYLVDHSHKQGDGARTIVSEFWERRCRLLKIPFILFYPQKFFSSMELDLRWAGKHVATYFQKPLRETLTRYERYRDHPNAIGPDRWSLGKIDIDQIDKVAGVLLDYSVNHSEP